MATVGQGWWTQPLPAGWEAKYDPNQKRYFFINHATKNTSWEDPRQTAWNQAQQYAQQSHGAYGVTAHAEAGTSWGGGGYAPSAHAGRSPQPGAGRAAQRRSPHSSPHGGHATQRNQLLTGGGHQPEAIQMRELSPKKQGWQREVEDKYNIRVTTMKDESDEEESGASSVQETSFGHADEEKVQKIHKMFPGADAGLIRRVMAKNRNVEGLTIMELQQAGYSRVEGQAHAAALITVRLKQQYPSADEAVIKDVLRGVNNSEAQAVQQLRSLGYASQQSSRTTSPVPTGGSHSRSSAHRTISPQRSASPARSVSPARAVSPVRREPTPAEKAALKNKMTEAFPDQAVSIIEIALDACKYDESKSRSLLESMATSQRAKSLTRSPARSPVSRMSEGRSASPSAASSGPSYNMDITAPSVSISAPISTIEDATPHHYTRSPKTSLNDFLTTSGSRGTHRDVLNSTSRPSSSSQIRNRSRTPERSSASPSPRPAPTSASRRAYVSGNRTNAKGPDSNLIKGSNKDLVITDYLVLRGPKAEFHLGPQLHNLSGPSRASGADPTLRHGPNAALSCGPDYRLRHGTIHPELTRPGFATSC